jgi:succinyl-diaminopimelate desuccinylase
MNAAIGNREIVELLRRLIQADSENPPGDVNRCAAVVAELLEREGIPFRLMESKPGVRNIWARLAGSKGKTGKGQTFLFNGHLDTVPAGNGWSLDPFAAEIKGNYMYGRGATDMKAGLASSLMAFVGLKRRGCPFAGEVSFTAVGDEEYHGQYGTKWLLANGLKADMAICCEPTNLDLCLGNRGLLMVDVVVKGKSAHGGRPNLGKNAISLATRIVRELEQIDLEGSRNDRFKDPVGNLSVVGMHGGDRINVIPDRCVFYIDRRLMPGENSDEAIRQIKRAITSVTGIIPDCADDNGSEIFIKPEIWHEAFWMSEAHPFVSQCIAVYKAHFGVIPVIEGKSAGTDASHLVSMGKIPTVIFGPGDYRESHTVDEKVELPQLMQAAGYYAHLVETILQPKEC